MYSIYHFFADLIAQKKHFGDLKNLEKFPYKTSLLSCRSKGMFPDLAIKINRGGVFSDGELVKLKDSMSYMIASFNSTIPTGTKEMAKP